jgi:hypothetical protein
MQLLVTKMLLLVNTEKKSALPLVVLMSFLFLLASQQLNINLCLVVFPLPQRKKQMQFIPTAFVVVLN